MRPSTTDGRVADRPNHICALKRQSVTESLIIIIIGLAHA